MPNLSNHTDEQLITLLSTDDGKVIEVIFKRYYVFLCRVLVRVLKDENMSEDLAQEVLYDIWRKRKTIHINTSLKAYLRRAAINKALNFIRDRKIKWEGEEQVPVQISKFINAPQQIEADELQQFINEAIDALPERCRLIFSLSRFEEMTYQEIANHLDISIKTVENQISKALKLLRNSLSHYL